jgi:hypothetical protein
MSSLWAQVRTTSSESAAVQQVSAEMATGESKVSKVNPQIIVKDSDGNILEANIRIEEDAEGIFLIEVTLKEKFK